MKTASKVTALALAALLSAGSVIAYAATEAAAPPSYETQKEMLKTADEALNAVTKAHAARLALFNDDIDTAKARLAEARSQFDNAEKGLNDLTIGDTEDPSSSAKYLPFDMSMALTEDFNATDQNKAALQKAYGLMQTGSKDDALDVLRLASIDVDVSAALLPVASTAEHLQDAQTLIDQGKYHEANLALKAVEDSVVVRSYAIDAIPQQGNIE